MQNIIPTSAKLSLKVVVKKDTNQRFIFPVLELPKPYGNGTILVQIQVVEPSHKILLDEYIKSLALLK